MTDALGTGRAARTTAFLLSAATLAWFLAAFGPAEPALRLMILGAGILTAVAVVIRPVWGLAAFLFLLLTANNWPHYFQSRNSSSFVRVAAILFLFLAAGWTLRRAAARRESGPETGDRRLPGAIRKPVVLASALIAVSAGIAFWRWANFYPIWGNGVFDWMTNSAGLPAALARRGVIMSAAGYLLPLAFLAIAARAMKNRAGVEAALRAVTVGLGFAVVFGYIQHFFRPRLGNLDFWVALRQINGTFIDPNAFGGVLAILLPLLAGAAWAGRAKAKEARSSGPWPAAAAATALLGTVCFAWIGARSSFLAFLAGAAVLAGGIFPFRKVGMKTNPEGAAGEKTAETDGTRGKAKRGKWRWKVGAALVLIVAGGALFFPSRLFMRIMDHAWEATAAGDLLLLSPERYFLWKHALTMTRDYPLSGVGVGAFIIELPDYYKLDKDPVPSGFEGFQRLDSAENFFLQAAAETGLIGLAVWIAVFAGAAWEMRKAVRAGILRGPDRWLFLGAAGGLTAFFVNALFHSFAQSFETIFCLGLVLAIIAVLGPGNEEAGGGRARDRRGWRMWPAAAVVLAAVFGLSSLRDSAGSLSIPAKSKAFELSQFFGLYHPEKDESDRPFHWTKGEAAWTVEVTGSGLRLPVRISHPDVADRPVRVKVSLGKFLLRDEIPLGEEVWTEPGRKVLEFPIPPGYEGKGMIRLSVDRTWMPSRFSESKDSRRLGAAVEQAQFF